MKSDFIFDEDQKEPTMDQIPTEDPEETVSENETEEASSDSPSSPEELYEEKEDEKEAEDESPSAAANFFDWIKSFLFSLTVVIFVFTLLFRGVTVNGNSMLPTLHSGEYLIISNLFYEPKPGDIVVVQSPHYKDGTEPLIKRIIATEGQTVRINFKTWEVWVDDVLLEEDYIIKEESAIMNYENMYPNKKGIAETVVEDNCIFVMGDHRNDSLDSRSEDVGQIDEHYIMGRVLLRITPFNRFGKVK